MKINPKFIVIISLICTLILSLMINLLQQFETCKITTRSFDDIKMSELYKKHYYETLDSCKKWGGTFSNFKDYYFLTNRDTNYIYTAILIEDYKTIDYRIFRDGLFCDICPDSIRTLIYSQDDAEDDFLNVRYGKNFKKLVRKRTKYLDQKYKIVYYDSILEKLTRSNYKRRILDNKLEIGILNKQFLDSLPFIIKIDSSNSSYREPETKYIFKETKNELIFKATKQSYQENYTLPTINILFYFDSLKTNFPYCKYPFKSINLY